MGREDYNQEPNTEKELFLDTPNSTEQSRESTSLACPSCDLVFDVSNLANGETARCSRCGHFLTRFRADELSRVMAFSVSALILLALACSFPFMAFKASGLESLIVVH